MREEFQHHLAERADDLVRDGLAPDAAKRRARREFGHEGTHRAQAREAMGLASFAQTPLLVARRQARAPHAARSTRCSTWRPSSRSPWAFRWASRRRTSRGRSRRRCPAMRMNRVRAIRHWDPLVLGGRADLGRRLHVLGADAAQLLFARRLPHVELQRGLGRRTGRSGRWCAALRLRFPDAGRPAAAWPRIRGRRLRGRCAGCRRDRPRPLVVSLRSGS